MTPRDVGAPASEQPIIMGLAWEAGTDSDSFQMTYNSHADEYLAITSRYVTTDTHAIAGQRLSPLGDTIVAATDIITDSLATRPAIAYSPTSDRYLVAWGHFFRQPDRSRSRLLAQPLAADMTPIGPPVELGTDTAYDISVVYNPDDDEFLVLWRDETIPPSQAKGAASFPDVTPTPPPSVAQSIYARRIRPDGSPIGSAVAIAVQMGTIRDGQFATPTAAYNTHDHEYLVVWQHSQQGLFTRRLSRTGEVVGEVASLAKPGGFNPHLAYNGDDNQYLLSYINVEDMGPAPGTSLLAARAHILSAEGSPQSEDVALLPGQPSPDTWAVAYNSQRQAYLVGIRNAVVTLSDQGAVVGEPTLASSDIVGIGVNNAGRYLIVERWWHLASVPIATATPEGASAITRWNGVVEVIQPAGDHSEWVVGGQSALVTRLTRIEEHAGPAAIGAQVEVVAHMQGSQKVADSIVVQPAAPPATATPTATPQATTPPDQKQHRLYLPYVSR